MPTSQPATCWGAFPGIPTWGWLMLSTTATTCSFVTGTCVMLASGWNIEPPLPRLDHVLLVTVVQVGRGPRHLDERRVDHDVVPADVPLADHDLQVDVPR